jgi:hypothetical protein
MNYADKFRERLSELARISMEAKEEILPFIVSKDVQDERLSICSCCENLDMNASICNKCDCFVKLKTKIAMFSCPIDKWLSVKI